MRPDMKVDTSGFDAAMVKAKMGADDLLNSAGAGAAVVVSVQKMQVPVDTAATRTSIKSHIIKSTRTEVIDDIGPETEYAPYIEYGVASKPNYPIQPFVRPSAHGKKRRDCINAITTAFHTWILSKWPK
jgi:hypothetical protein